MEEEPKLASTVDIMGSPKLPPGKRHPPHHFSMLRITLLEMMHRAGRSCRALRAVVILPRRATVAAAVYDSSGIHKWHQCMWTTGSRHRSL
jgi:hypothetical protein